MQPSEIIPGLHQLTRTGVNIFILETRPDELTLVDAGFPGSAGAIVQAISNIGKTPQHLKQILITHADLDHVGSLSGLVQASGATVYASEESTPYIHRREAPPHLPAFATFLSNPVQKLIMGTAQVNAHFSDHTVLDITDEGIEALHTPGHTPDNYSFFWRARRVLFAPDLLFTQGDTLAPSPAIISWNTQAVYRSIEKVLQLEPEIICVGHGQAVNLVQQPQLLTQLEQKLAQGMSRAAV